MSIKSLRNVAVV